MVESCFGSSGEQLLIPGRVLVGEGVLICGAAAKRGGAWDSLEDSVAVKKTGRGKVELEGAVSEVYYKVRKEVYSLHALVAA